MRRTSALAVTATLAAVLLAPVSAFAWGALAISQADDGAWSYGLTTQRSSRQEAIDAAMQLCRNERYGGNCRVVTTFNGLCIGVAFRNGGNGFGWATRQSEREARAAAHESCLDSNPSCSVEASRCDPAGAPGGAPGADPGARPPK
jgi:hypothetical protein